MDNRGKLLKPSEIAERLGVSRDTITKYLRSNRLPSVQTPGGHYRVYESDLEDYIAKTFRRRDAGGTIITLINQKGGVGKTTATANLGTLLHQIGMRVLLVDLDPQGSLTRSLGHNPDAVQFTIFDAMTSLRTGSTGSTINTAPGAVSSSAIGRVGVGRGHARNGELPASPSTYTSPSTTLERKLILGTDTGPDLAPNNILASEADWALYGEVNWGTILGRVLEPVKRNYDYILLDCPPSFNSLTMNALNVADWLVIPTQYEMLSIDGLRQLLMRVQDARTETNGKLRVAGVVAMMVQHANSNREVEQVLQEGLAQSNLGVRVFQTIIKRSTLFGNVANRRQVLVASQPKSEHARAYRLLLAELLNIVGGPGERHIPLLESEQFGDFVTNMNNGHVTTTDSMGNMSTGNIDNMTNGHVTANGASGNATNTANLENANAEDASAANGTVELSEGANSTRMTELIADLMFADDADDADENQTA